MIIWITGLSGAGKTTLAQHVTEALKHRGAPVVLLDGDALRWVVQDPAVGHDRASRLTNAYRIARMAKLLEEQGLTVVVATMSLFHEIHAWNRQEFREYLEVWLEVDSTTLRKRDPRGLYTRFEQGTQSNVVGLDLPCEKPRAPHLVLNNNQPGQDFAPFTQAVLTAAEGLHRTTLCVANAF